MGSDKVPPHVVAAVLISWLLGWVYFLAWTISFFPQALLNIKRRTTQGLLPDFPLLNVYGFSCYTLSTGLFLLNPTIRSQYAARHPVSPEPTVRTNDFFFGILALSMSILTYSQFWPRLWGWEYSPGARRHVNSVTMGLIFGSFAAIITTTLIVASKGEGNNALGWAWIDVVYTMEYIKLAMTVFKYIPQVVANFRRRSTIGWSITQQLLDFTGGIGSLLQLVIDSSLQNDWSGLTGNPLKFGLANISLIFDVIFILQHFVFFGPVEESDASIDQTDAAQDRSDREPLLPGGARA